MPCREMVVLLWGSYGTHNIYLVGKLASFILKIGGTVAVVLEIGKRRNCLEYLHETYQPLYCILLMK
jgi:hypothetical protein